MIHARCRARPFEGPAQPDNPGRSRTLTNRSGRKEKPTHLPPQQPIKYPPAAHPESTCIRQLRTRNPPASASCAPGIHLLYYLIWALTVFLFRLLFFPVFFDYICIYFIACTPYISGSKFMSNV